MLSCWYEFFGGCRLGGKTLFLQGCRCEIGKAHSGERCSQPPGPSVVNTRAEVAAKTHTGWVPSLQGCFGFPGLWDSVSAHGAGCQERSTGTGNESPLRGNELIPPSTPCVNWVGFNAFKLQPGRSCGARRWLTARCPGIISRCGLSVGVWGEFSKEGALSHAAIKCWLGLECGLMQGTDYTAFLSHFPEWLL